jgi:hypothetical protein
MLMNMPGGSRIHTHAADEITLGGWGRGHYLSILLVARPEAELWLARHGASGRDPSLRLKNGYAQDDSQVRNGSLRLKDLRVQHLRLEQWKSYAFL